MEYPEAENLVFSSAIAGVKNVLGDLSVVVVALVSIYLIVAVVKFITKIFFEHEVQDKVEGDNPKFKNNKLIRKISEND